MRCAVGIGFPLAMKLLYKPFSAISSAIAAKVGQSTFRSVWSKVDDAEPPHPTTAQATVPKILGAVVLEAAIMAAVGALADRASARAFEHLTGAWPGEQTQEPADD
jgi:hypothetical protein